MSEPSAAALEAANEFIGLDNSDFYFNGEKGQVFIGTAHLEAKILPLAKQMVEAIAYTLDAFAQEQVAQAVAAERERIVGELQEMIRAAQNPWKGWDVQALQLLNSLVAFVKGDT